MTNGENRRFSIGLGFILDVRLTLAAYAKRTTRANLAEKIVTDHLTENGGWAETRELLRQEAALKGIDLKKHLAAILAKDSWIAERIDPNADLSILLDNLIQIESEEEE